MQQQGMAWKVLAASGRGEDLGGKLSLSCTKTS
jgi:hypothetical protein